MIKKIISVVFLFLLLIAFKPFMGCKKIVIEKPGLNTDTTPSVLDCKTFQDPTKKFFIDVPNLGFEVWKMSASKKYEDPEPSCFWTTPNRSRDIINAIPATVFKVGGDSAYSGKYAAMIKTGKWAGLIMSGTIAAGSFSPNLSNPLQSISFGKPFKKRPKSISGYYKYYSVEGDSCSVYCFVTKQKTVSGKKVIDTLGFANMITSETKTTYTKFDLPLTYKTNENPDRLVVYFSSSEAGDELKGQAGSTMFIDEVKILY